ncbi:MAG: septum formation initiator family protein [Ignavibacteriales bacterium]|nr:septum formation initiator family protein [Ignavibacteriales bacterium]
MEFYRKPSSQALLKNLTRKTLKHKRRVFFLFLGLFIGSYVVFGNYGILTRIRLERQRSETLEKIRKAQEETQNLLAQIKRLETDKHEIEKIAREKYGMAREGETVYRVKKD